MYVHLYVDDARNCPHITRRWVTVRSYAIARQLMESGLEVKKMSLDHDMGDSFVGLKIG